MFRLSADVRVYLHRDPIDFRAGIDSLAILVEQSMGLNPFERAVFAFCNRRRDRVKLLFFDRSGFVLILRRLEEDRFYWPNRRDASDDRTASLASRRHRHRSCVPTPFAAVRQCRGTGSCALRYAHAARAVFGIGVAKNR